MLIFYGILLLSCNFCANILGFTDFTKIYHYIPEFAVSQCTRRLNTTNQVGCSSGSGPTSGQLVFVNESDSLISTLNDSSSSVAISMEFDIFLNDSLMHFLRSSTIVSGLIVFAPSMHEKIEFSFSESNICPNALYSASGATAQCATPKPWNPYGKDYSTISWPFPVVLIQANQTEIKNDLYDCYQSFNAVSQDDTKCMIEFSSAMSAVQSSTTCTRRQYLMSFSSLQITELLCDELTGFNIILSASNKSVGSGVNTETPVGERPENSSLLVITRMDSRSMFERSGFGSQGVLPSVAVLLSTAVHLMKQNAFKDLQLKYDVFFMFLDNEAYDFLGSRHLSYDLANALLARYTGVPLAWKHVYAVIEIGEVGVQSANEPSTFFMLSNASIHQETADSTKRLIDALQAAGRPPDRVHFIEPSLPIRELPLPPAASLQTLLQLRRLPHLLLADHGGPPMANKRFESFLDIQWPPKASGPKADKILLAFATTLADALHTLVVKGDQSLPSGTMFPTPGDFMHCFVNEPTCDLLKLFLSPADIDFLASFKTPIPTQSYLPVNQREIKLSHVVSMLLMGLTGHLTPTPECPVSNSTFDPYFYVMGNYNGTAHCYRTLMDITSLFTLYHDDRIVAPGWMRSRRINGKHYVRWYRSASPYVDGISVSIGILSSIFVIICAFSVRRLLTIQANSTVGTAVEVPNTPDNLTAAA